MFILYMFVDYNFTNYNVRAKHIDFQHDIEFHPSGNIC